MSKIYIRVLLLTLFYSLSLSLFAQQIPSYYNGSNLNLTGNDLRNELNQLVNSNTVKLTYTPGVWDALKQSDLDPNNSNNVLLIYGSDDNDNNYITDRSRSKDANGGTAGSQWNREHTYPRSVGTPPLDSGDDTPYSDAHLLRPSDITQNSNRGNSPFGSPNPNQQVGSNGLINAHAFNNAWYPGEEWKGDAARIIMYMYTRYGNRCLPNNVGTGSSSFSSDMPDIFLQWNVEDPVSDFELQRNPILEGIQGNRNPFIDNPAFATQIWGGPQAEDRFGESLPFVMINEIDADTRSVDGTTGNDELEFIELFDGGSGNKSLNGLVVVLYNGSNNESYAAYDLDGFSTNTEGYFVIGDADVSNVEIVLETSALQNGADAVAIYEADATDFPNGTLVTDENLIDALVYDTSDGDVTSLIDVLTPGQQQIDENGNADKDNESIQRLPNGSGGLRATATFSTALPTPGISNDIPDTEAPTAPTNLVASNETSSTIDLTWNESTDNAGVTAYKVFQDGVEITTTSNLTYTVTALNSETEYSFTISAVDAAGNESAESNAVMATTLTESTGNTGDNALILTAVYDGPRTGGTPKGVELYVKQDIADLSIYGLGSANNGGGTDGEEFTFPAESASAGDYIYVSTEVDEFTTFFGFAPDYTSGAMAINGDDAVELFKNGEVVDIFGEIDVDGTGQPWDHLDGWAYRVANTGPDGSTFVLENWTFSGTNVLDGENTNATAATPVPIKSYISEVTEPLVLTAVYDGPRTGGTPKGVELYVKQDIADLSIYGLGSANNGGGTDGEEFTFPAESASAGEYIYVSTEVDEFTTFFGFAPNYTDGAMAINGDDAVELFKNGEVVDIFGEIDVDGTGQPWDHLDGWAYRMANTGPDGSTFVLENWTFSGTNALDGENTNATAATPVPIKSFAGSTTVDDEAPTTPTNLVASNETSSTIDLTWNAATDNVSVTGYKVFQDGVEIATTTDLTYTVTALSSETEYSFTISAVDAAGNESTESNAVMATTLADAIEGTDSSLVLTAVYDGPRTGGTPKGVELYVKQDIANLSVYGLGSANNGGGTDGEEFTFPAESANAGDYIYVALEDTEFTTFFGFAPNYTNGSMAINGDDAVELFKDGEVVDVFGEIDVDGNGQPWEYLDGWAYRVSNTGPDGSTFVLENWTFSGANVLDNEETNAAAETPVPIATYISEVIEPLVLTAVYDGPRTGGTPKGVELYVRQNISDLSIYGLGSANNGGGTDGEEFTFPAESANAGDYIYVALEDTEFTTFFGFAPNYTDGAMAINGDDAVELFKNGEVVDIFGDIDVDGNGQPWEYLDGWAYRVSNTGPDGSTFVLENWTFSGANVLDGENTNATAATPVPIKSFVGSTTVDNEAPTAPTNLVASNETSSTIDLTWNAATDNVGVTGYKVYQNGVEIATTADLTFTVTGLSPESDYTFTVTALDAVENESAQSEAIMATTLVDGGLITVAQARALPDGSTVTITGVVTVSDQFGGPAFLQDETAGIAVFDSQLHGDGLFNIGDRVELTATRASFNDQIQLSSVSALELIESGVEITPLVITASEIENFPGQLVQINDVTFQDENGLFCGETNFDFSDNTGSTELRIDGDVESIIGNGVPATCSQIVGVVGRFRQFFQLLPRFESDLPCSGTFLAQMNPEGNSSDETLDVLTWNIEWFGAEDQFGTPSRESGELVQKDAVKAIIQEINPDLIGVQEIVDVALFYSMVDELDGYSAMLSDATSYPNDTEGNKQRVGFIYKTDVINPTSFEALLTNAHPYYNGGDESLISDYPVSDKTRFYASGRLPYLMDANVTLNGATENIKFIVYHARANGSSDSQSRYDMRKYDVEFLKAYLDTELANDNIILLGDFNDDVDETVADNVNTTESTYSAFINDADNYNTVSGALSAAGYNSFAFRDNMIDHVMISNELFDNYVVNSTTIWNTYYDCDYTSTTTDHFAVSARFELSEPLMAEVYTLPVDCFGEETGELFVEISGGTEPYQTSLNGAEYMNTTSYVGLAAGNYSLDVIDVNENMVSFEDILISEPDEILVTLNNPEKVYIGLNDDESTEIRIESIVNGDAPFTYSWNTGSSSESINVYPNETTTYTVKVTDANGCSVVAETKVEVEDISCLKNKVSVCLNGKTYCVGRNSIQRYLNRGATLGSCDGDVVPTTPKPKVTPNPVIDNATIVYTSDKAGRGILIVTDQVGQNVIIKRVTLQAGANQIELDMSSLPSGLYTITIRLNGGTGQLVKVVKE